MTKEIKITREDIEEVLELLQKVDNKIVTIFEKDVTWYDSEIIADEVLPPTILPNTIRESLEEISHCIDELKYKSDHCDLDPEGFF